MTGVIYREKVLNTTGLRFNEVARAFGMSTAALDAIFKSPDVKSGYIERAIEVLGMKVSDFFEYEQPEPIVINNDESEMVRYLMEQNRSLVETNLALAKSLAK